MKVENIIKNTVDMKATMKEITVLMTVYNTEKFVEKAIESVLKQTYTNFDFLIVEDCSQDKSKEIIQKYEKSDSRINVIYLDKNIGTIGASNLGLSNIETKWVARLDADDVMYPERLETQISFLKAHPDYCLTASWIDYINDKDEIIGNSHSELTDWQKVKESMQKNQPVGFCHSSVMFEKEYITKIGGYRVWPAEDIDLWNRVIESDKKIIVLPQTLTAYRISSSSITIKKTLESYRKYRYVKHCMILRRSGKEEISWEEFQKIKRSPYKKINMLRKDYAQYYRKKGVNAFASKKYLSAIYTLVISTILRPMQMINTLRNKSIQI